MGAIIEYPPQAISQYDLATHYRWSSQLASKVLGHHVGQIHKKISKMCLECGGENWVFLLVRLVVGGAGEA